MSKKSSASRRDTMHSPGASGPPSLPSSPLSNLSHTPSLPESPLTQRDAAAGRYPSPRSLSVSSDASLRTKMDKTKQANKTDGTSSQEAPRLIKKRRVAAPRDRTTKHLDLTKDHEDVTCDDEFQMQRLIRALHNKKKIVVVAGAGMSVAAGIPDFRSASGLFANNKRNSNNKKCNNKLTASGKHLFDASVYSHDSSTQSFHTMVRKMARLTRNASPTAFHQLVASLAKEGRLLRLYSQNIDCIDTSMKPLATTVPLQPKGPWPPTIQLHGGLHKMVCTKCGDLQAFDDNLFDGPEAPLCPECKKFDEVRDVAGKRSHGIGRLRPRLVLYNEYHPDDEAIGNVARADLKARPDAVLVVGTSLKVPGTRRLVKEMCQVARGRKDGFTAWINIDAEPRGVEFRNCWDLVVRSTCDNVARLVALPPYDCGPGANYLLSSEQYAAEAQAFQQQNIEVRLPSTTPPCSVDDDDDDDDDDANKSALHVDDANKSGHAHALAAIPTPRPSPPVDVGLRQSKLSTFVGVNPDGRRRLPAKAPGPRTKRQGKQPTRPDHALVRAFKPAKKMETPAAGSKADGSKADGQALPKAPCGLPSLRPEIPNRPSMPVAPCVAMYTSTKKRKHDNDCL